MKPVAAGFDEHGVNDDVERLLAASSIQPPRALVNPYGFRAAIAPHIAAQEEGRSIELPPIVAAFAQLQAMADAVLVEGVGGFCVPLADQPGPGADTAALAVELGFPVLLVVGLRLGCINHALLTAEAVQRRGLSLAGWLANEIAPALARADEVFGTLERWLPAPCVGRLSHAPGPDWTGAAAQVRIDRIEAAVEPT
jgi:dethiobiotin synthetase